jgi:phosphoglycerol transferase
MNLLTASVILLLAAILLLYKQLTRRTAAIAVSSMVFVFAFFTIFYFVSDYFTGEGINDAVWFQISYGFSGAGFTEYGLLFIVTAAFLTSGALLSTICFRQIKTDNLQRPNVLRISVSILLMLGAFGTHPAVQDLTNIALYDLHLLRIFKRLMSKPTRVPAGAQAEFIYSYKKDNDINTVGGNQDTYAGQSDVFSGKPALSADFDEEYESEFMESYRSPWVKEVNKRHSNIVYIFAEGLERTYFDENIFPGLIKELRSLENQSISFTGITQTAGGSWTIGGIVSSQCGIPLVTAQGQYNAMSGIDSFYPGAVCIGDLLNEMGYSLTFMGGASLDFAGKGAFFRTHQFDTILGRDELTPLLSDSSYKTGWGLFDDSLFDLAYNEFVKLSEQNFPFGLFLLTLDTHHPSGFPSASCKDIKYGDGSLIQCSMQ